MGFAIGDFVGVKCEVASGPFSDEKLITVDTIEGAISGFVQEVELRQANGEWQVRAKVKSIGETHVEVWILGSFFTTNGIASVPNHLAMAA